MSKAPITLTDEELTVLLKILADKFSSGVNPGIARPRHAFYMKIRSAAASRGIPLPHDDALARELLEQAVH